MARAIDWAMRRTPSAGDDEWNFQIKGLAHAVANGIPEFAVSTNPDAQPDKRSYGVSSLRFRVLAPDHQTEMTLNNVLHELRIALEKMVFQDENFRDSFLVRYSVLEPLKEQGLLTSSFEWIGGQWRKVSSVFRKMAY